LYKKRESPAGQDFVGEARARGYSPTVTSSNNNSNNKSLADWPGKKQLAVTAKHKSA